MDRRSLCALAGTALAAALAAPPPLRAQSRRLVTIASGWVVGVYYPLAGAMSRIVDQARDLGIRAVVEASGASVANAQLIGGREADFALLQNDVAFYAYNGSTLAAFQGKPIRNMSGVFTIYPELVHVIATRGSRVRKVSDLKGRKVVLGPQGSGTEANAVQILEAYGLKASDIQPERMDAAPAAEQLEDGRVDAAFFTTGLGSGVLVEMFSSGKTVLLPVDGPQGRALTSKYPFYTVVTVPANTYKDQGQISTVGVMAMLVARTDLPEDLVYGFTRAIFDHLKQFHDAHPAARSLSLESALIGMPIPLHPGAEKFYRERGIKR